MLKTIALTMGIVGAIAFGTPVKAELSRQGLQESRYSQENTYWTQEDIYLIQKSCQWFMSKEYSVEDVYEYLNYRFSQSKPYYYSSSSSQSLVESMDDLVLQAAKIKAILIVSSGVDLMGASNGQCR